MGNNETDAEITLEKSPQSDAERSKALIKEALSRPNQDPHSPQYTESGNLPSPSLNFVQKARQVQAEVNEQKAKTLKDVLPQKENTAAQIREQKQKAISAPVPNIELPEMSMVDHPPEEDLSDTGAFDSGNFSEVARIAESSGNDSAVNARSGATGRYQFVERTWNNLMEQYPDAGLTADGRTNGDQQEIAMGLLTDENKTHLENKNIPVTNGSMYVMHTLGAGRGSRMLQAAIDGNTRPAAELVSAQVVEQNPTWFEGNPTPQELVDLLASKVTTPAQSEFTGAGDPKSDPKIKAGTKKRKKQYGGYAGETSGVIEERAIPIEDQLLTKEQRDRKIEESIAKGVDPRYPDLNIPHTPSPISTPNIPQAATTEEEIPIPAIEAPPAEEGVSGGGFTSLESGTGPTEIPPKPGVIAQSYIDLKKGVSKAGELLPSIDVEKEWDQLLDSIDQADDLFLLGLGKGKDSLKNLASKFMQHENITGVSPNKAIAYIKEHYNEFTAFVKEQAREPEVDIDNRDPGKDREKAEAIQKRDQQFREYDKKVAVEEEKPGVKTQIVEEGIIEGPKIYKRGNYDLDRFHLEPSSHIDDFDDELNVTPEIEDFGDTMSVTPEVMDLAEGMVRLESLESDSPVKSTYGTNVFEHEDGTWSVKTVNGKVVGGLNEIIAKSYGDYHVANMQGIAAGAPTDSGHEYFNRVMGGLAVPVEMIFQATTGPTTLQEKVDEWNDEGNAPITAEILKAYNAKSLNKTDPSYKTLARLEQEAKVNLGQFESIGKFADGYRKYFPVNRKHIAGAATAFKLIHKNKGTGDALLHAFDNIGVFMEQGFDSVGFTLALTLGNLPVQLGMLAALAQGQAQKMIVQYTKDNHGVEPSREVRERIKISAAFSLAAEKISLGYMKGVVKGLPVVGDPIKWVDKVGKAINKQVGRSITASLAKSVIVKPAISFLAEGAQERVSQEAEHYGLTGKWLSPEAGALAWVEGTTAAPGVGGTLIALQVGGKVVGRITSPSQLKIQKKDWQHKLNFRRFQQQAIDHHDSVFNLDEQISNLEESVGEVPGGVETDNKRFIYHYDRLRTDGVNHTEAIAAAREQIAKELGQLQTERAELVKDSPPLRVKDTQFGDTLRGQIKEIDKQISESKDAESIARLENQKRDVEAKLNTAVSREQFNAHKNTVLKDRISLEKIIEFADKRKSRKAVQPGEAFKVLTGDKLKTGELTTIVDDLARIAGATARFVGVETGEPVSLSEGTTYVPEAGSGLKIVKKTTDGVTTSTVELIPEPKEWLDDQGRRLTRKDFTDPVALKKFLNETKEFDANQKKGKTKLAELRKQEAELKPEDINPYRRQSLLQKLREVANRDLNDEERVVLNKLIKDYKEKGLIDPTEGTKSEADKLFSGPDPFGDAQEADPKDLKKAINDPNTDPETKKHLVAILKAQRDKKKREKNVHDKNIDDVHKEIISGESGEFKGLHSYRDDIIALFKNPSKLGVKALARKVQVQMQAMNVHSENLSKKLSAFKEAANRNADTPAGVDEQGNKRIWVVRGNRATNEDGSINTSSRTMTYSVEKMTESDYITQRETDGKYINRIDVNSSTASNEQKNGSAKLIRILEEEVKSGKLAVDAVNSYEGTSIQKGEVARREEGESQSKFIAELTELEGNIGVPVDEITDIDDITATDETKTEEERTEPKDRGVFLEDELKALEEEYKTTTDDNRKEYLGERIFQLKSLIEQSAEDREFEGENESTNDSSETPKPPPESSEQADSEEQTVPPETDEGDKTTEDKGEPESIKEVFQDFITSATKKYWPVIKTASISSLDRMLGMLNSYFSDLVQIGPTADDLKIAGIHTLKDTDFEWTQEDVDSGKHSNIKNQVGQFSGVKLYRALVKLGMGKPGAKVLAKKYKEFKKRYENIVYKELRKGDLVQFVDSDDTTHYKVESITDGKAKLENKTELIPLNELIDIRNYALRQPLSILLRKDEMDLNDQVGKLPDQVLLGMMLGAMTFRQQKPNNKRFTSDWERQLFLYGNKSTSLTADEEAQLKDIGYGYGDSSENIGRDITALLRMSAKTVGKEGALTQEGANLYFENLVPALGMMAIEIAQGKDSEALFEVHEHAWKFAEDYEKGRKYNNADPKDKSAAPHYKHIKVPLDKDDKPRKIKSVEIDAVDELVKVTKTDILTHGDKPFQDPQGDNVAKSIKGTLGNIPKKVRNALKNLQNQKWNAAETMDTVAALKEHKKMLHKLMGVTSIVGNIHHESHKDAIESSNSDKISDLQEILDAYEHPDNLLEDFYYRYELQNHHRIMMQGRINPQQSKVTRFLLRSWEAQTYNADNLWKFKLAVAQNFGIGVDKNDLIFAEQAFDDIIENGNVLDAVKALHNITNKNGDPKEQAQKLADALEGIKNTKEYEDGNISIINGITALANYMPNGVPQSEFKSDVVMEIDGISNGFAMNVMQFPMWEGKDLDTVLSQIGNYFDVRSKHDTTKPDIYETLIKHVLVGADHVDKDGNKIEVEYNEKNDKWTGGYPEHAWEHHQKNNWKDDFEPLVHKFKTSKNQDDAAYNRTREGFKYQYRKWDAAVNDIFPDFTLPDKLRKVVKYPFLIYMYGGGVDRISKDVTKEIIKSVYEKAGTIQTEYNALSGLLGTTPGPSNSQNNYFNTKAKDFIDSLEALGAFQSGKDRHGNNVLTREAYETALRNGESLDKFFNEKHLTARISQTIAPRFSHGLNTMLGQTEEARSSVIEMGEVLHATFMAHYKRAYNKKLKQINDDYKKSYEGQRLIEQDSGGGAFVERKRLTKRELTDLIKDVNGELIQVFPQYESPLSSIIQNKNGEEYIEGFVDLSETEFVTTTDKGTDLPGGFKSWSTDKTIDFIKKEGAKLKKGEGKKLLDWLKLSLHRQDEVETITGRRTITEETFLRLQELILSDRTIDTDRIEAVKKGANGKKQTVNTNPSQLRFIEPGVSALIRQIINMDSVILTQTLNGTNRKGDPKIRKGFTGDEWTGDTELLMLHDAFMGSPEQLSTISEIYGKIFLAYSRQHSIYEKTHDQVLKVLEFTKQLDDLEKGPVTEPKEATRDLVKLQKVANKILAALRIASDQAGTPEAKTAQALAKKLLKTYGFNTEKFLIGFGRDPFMEFTETTDSRNWELQAVLNSPELIGEKYTPTLMDDISEWVFYESYENKSIGDDLKRITLHDKLQRFKRTGKKVAEARQRLEDRIEAEGMVSHQMYMAQKEDLITSARSFYDVVMQTKVKPAVEERQAQNSRSNKGEVPVKYVDKIISAVDGKRRVAAQTDHKNNQILIDKAEVERTFKEKAWMFPKMEGVNAFPENAFKTLEEWETFLIAHERAHFTASNQKRPQGFIRENHANTEGYIAVKQLRIRYEREQKRKAPTPEKKAPPRPKQKTKGKSLQDRMTAKIAKVISDAARKWLPKEQVKTRVATQFIGDGSVGSSSYRYRAIYHQEGLANTGKYTAEDVIFIASNGARSKRIDPVKNGELQGAYKNITAAIKAGATIIMDTEAHLAKHSYNIGEAALAKYLADNGYAREGQSGVWKPKSAKGGQGTKTLTEGDKEKIRKRFSPMYLNEMMKAPDLVAFITQEIAKYNERGDLRNQGVTESDVEEAEEDIAVLESLSVFKKDSKPDPKDWTWESFTMELTDSEKATLNNLLSHPARLFSEAEIIEWVNNPSVLLDQIIAQQKEEADRDPDSFNEDAAYDGSDQEDAFINDGKKEIYTIITDLQINDEMDPLKTLDGMPKDPTDKAKELGDITKNNIKKLFNKFKSFSSGHYSNKQEMNDHTETLDTVLNILNEGIAAVGGIKLTLQHINGITQGEYDIASKSMGMFLSNNAPFSNNSQSPQEVYVHELLHATTALAIRENPLVAERVERLYVQTEDAITAKYGEKQGYKVFLVKGVRPSANDITMAKRQYNYVFKGKETAKLHEFLAYAVTNKQMIDFLKTQPRPVREGILGKLLDMISLAMDVVKEAFGGRSYRNTSGNAFMEMIAATEHLVAIQAKHESIYQKYSKKAYASMDNSDKFLKQFAEDIAVRVAGDPDKRQGKFRKGARIVTGGLNTIFGESEGARRARQQVDRIMSKTLRGLASEIGSGVLTEDMIEQLLHVKVNISKARQQAETFTNKWFNGDPDEGLKGIWKSVDPLDRHAMTVQTKIAITEIMLRTDLSALRNKGTEFELSHKEIMGLVGKDQKTADKRKAMQSMIIGKLRIHNSHKAIAYANELGHHIVTGNTRLHRANMNATSIALDYLKNPTPEQIALLDTYATLSALNHTDSTQDIAVKTLSNNEFAKDSKNNGMTEIIDYHLEYKKNSKKDLFSDNATQMVKGYIVERVDNFTHVKVGTKADIARMKKEGYSEHYELTKVDPKQTYDTLFVTRTIPEVTDVSGVMSTTNQRNMGTTLTEILVRDPAFHHKKGPNQGQPDFHLIKVKIKKFIAAEEKAAENLEWDNSLKLRPVFDEHNNITDYRVMMDNEWKKELLQPDLEFQNVFAHMRSAAVDRKETIESDKKTVELLVYEQMDMMEAHPDMKWVDIMDPDSPYIDRYRKLPREVRELIKEYALNGQFMVREDIVDKVFGYKAFDLTQLKLLQSDKHPLAKRIAGVTHHAIKQTVSYGKNRIVIAMPQVVVGNMMSNIYQLLMRKIPIDFIFHKIYEGISEYNKYGKDTKERTRLNAEIRAKGLDAKTSEQAIKVARLNDRIKGNLIHRMSLAGLNSLIVEDINDSQTDGYLNKLRKTVPSSFPSAQKYIDRVPPVLGDIASFLFMTKNSKPYQLSRHVVQMTDFLGRYVMIEHATKVQGRGFNEAMHEALNAFVLFDEALVPALEAIDAVGATSFLSYYLRNARSSRQLVQTSPTGVAMSAAFQHATGVPTLGNVNSSWIGGKFSPNYLQTDDLFDEANNVTLYDIVMNDGRNLFD
jgi:hypothetical protein